MDTMRDVLKNAAAGQDFHLLLGDFLDEFYRADAVSRQKMIADCPDGDAPETLPFAAAAAHKLANDFGLAVPDWVFEKRCYSARPFFGCRARSNLRLLFMYQSPAEFKHRNLFVDENVLNRV
jgi:hypothetical protein